MKVKFSAKILNMNVNKITVVLIIQNISPDMFVKLLPGKHLAPVQNKVL